MKRVSLWFATLAALTLALAPVLAHAQYGVASMPKACWPEQELHGRDTVYALLPCNNPNVYPPGMRRGFDCTMAKMHAGGWDAIAFETYRSDRRQQYLYSYGRTRPGPKVTNAASALTGVHYYRYAADIISRKRGWNHPRFFHWLMIHAESCGMVAGKAWKKFSDAPHIQFGAWPGSPPQWARAIARDSIGVVWLRTGAAR